MRPFASTGLVLIALLAAAPARRALADDDKDGAGAGKADAPKTDAVKAEAKADPAKKADAAKAEPEKGDKDGSDAKKDETPALVTAEKGTFAVVLELEGTLDAKAYAEIDVHTDVYGGELEAKSTPVLVPTPVKAGQVLVAFDTERIDDQIEGARRDLELAKVALARAKEEAKRVEAEAARNLAREKLERDRAAESLAYFVKVERARRTTESEMELKSTNDAVTDQVEELEQLKKMYKADDVVEETEKIVMARSERALERSKKWLALRTESHARLVDVELPRELEDREHAAARSTSDYEKSVATVPMELEKTRREIAKSEQDLAVQTKSLGKLEKDRALFAVVAPADGIAVPGTLTDGKWSGGEDVVKAFKSKESVKPHQRYFTLVTSPAFVLRVDVAEASILDVAVGQKAEVRLAVAPKRVLSAVVASVSRTSKDGKFDVVLDVAEHDERWWPGFSAKAKLTTVTKADAITVPEDAVVTKGETHTVNVWVDGKSVAKEVEVGATSGGRTEIVRGLDAGAKVLEHPPK